MNQIRNVCAAYCNKLACLLLFWALVIFTSETRIVRVEINLTVPDKESLKVTNRPAYYVKP